MARSVQLSESICSRLYLQPSAVRADQADPGCVARALSGTLTSTSQAASSTNGRRCLKHRRKCLEHESGDWSWRASVGLKLTGDPEHSNCSWTGRRYWKVGRHRFTISCRSPNEARTSCGTFVTPRTLWQRLKPTINYLSGAQLCMVNDALQLAYKAHDGQKRRSGEPFIIHPVEVANILGELEMDWETIVAGLLHDTVEDTENVTFEGIEQQFGLVVRRIVEGETKVSKLGKMQYQQSETKSRDVKADDLRQMFLAMTEEVRVIIVKLADRLHNMRTLSHMPPHKQQHIAQETLQVFAPLAKLLGMYRIKSELEDLSFMYANGDEYKSIKQRVAALCKEQEDVLLEGRKVLLETIEKDQFLGDMTLDVKVGIQYKELYSLYKKLLETKCCVDEIRDIAQLRVILKLKPGASVGQMCAAQQVCYHVLGLVHAMWPPVPGTVKDYIATPKPNGYQSLHTTVIPFGSTTYFPLEIQLRTEEMDKLAEWGIAAHHSGRGVLGYDPDIVEAYSGKNMRTANGSARRGWSNILNHAEIGRRVSWLNSIREWQEEFVGNMTSREFVDAITGDLLGSRVFVFTPRGEIKNLPKGATVVDYAYQIHTDVGNKMVAAKVNGNLVSPTHTLVNAEVVEVITYDGASQRKLFELHRQWLHFARTRSARHKLTKFLREQATLSAEELTAESVKDFVGEFSESDGEDLDDESDGRLASELFRSSNTDLAAEVTNGSLLTAFLSPAPDALMGHGMVPAAIVQVSGTAVNGKPNVLVDESFRRSGNHTNGTARAISSATGLRLAIEEEARVKFEAWQSGRVAMWHGSGGRSLQWLSICCIDRKCMLAEVTSLLGASGILICACAAETDQRRRLGIMIFHVEGDQASLVRACSNVESIGGVLSWATGCTWQSPQTARHYL